MAAAGTMGSEYTWANNSVLLALARELKVDVAVGSYWHRRNSCSKLLVKSEERAQWSRAKLQIIFQFDAGHYSTAWSV